LKDSREARETLVVWLLQSDKRPMDLDFWAGVAQSDDRDDGLIGGPDDGKSTPIATYWAIVPKVAC
jgi:hypothetical protein